jgi:hypothetical protein
MFLEGEAFDCKNKRVSAVLFFAEEGAGIGDIEFGEVHSRSGRALFCEMKLAGEIFNGTGGKILDDANAGLRFENRHEQSVFIHIVDEQAEIFSLLVNAVEIRLLDQTGDGLVGHERAGGQGRDGGEVKIGCLALAGDKKSALVREQCRCRIGAVDKSEKNFVKLLNVFFDELWQGGHVYIYCKLTLLVICYSFFTHTVVAQRFG